jgi:translation initiation factor IF-1
MSNTQEGQKEGTLKGVVVEALPNTTFRVECINDAGEMQPVIAYLAGKMRLHRIKVVCGDSVDVLLDGYSTNKGRITRRHDAPKVDRTQPSLH